MYVFSISILATEVAYNHERRTGFGTNPGVVVNCDFLFFFVQNAGNKIRYSDGITYFVTLSNMSSGGWVSQ